MIGDKLLIEEHHREAAREISQMLLSDINASSGKYVITIAGESGSGKSELASALSDCLDNEGIECFILQQDDFFVLPPHSNAKKRKKDIGWVGMEEVRLDLMDGALSSFKMGCGHITTPLVLFEEDRIEEETIDVEEVEVLIAEGTYTTTLQNVDTRIFIEATYHQTHDARIKRGRDLVDDFTEQVLEIEHAIICRHKERADIIITPDYEVRDVR